MIALVPEARPVRAVDLVRGHVIRLGVVREVVHWRTEDGLVLVDVYVRGSDGPHTFGAEAMVEVRT